MTASCLYAGRIAHRRIKPRAHFLQYRLFQIFLDLDEASALSARNRLFGFNQAGLLSFYETDHGDGSQRPLKHQIVEHARAAGYETGGPVRVLCLPRVLGFVFNPISVWFVHAADGAPSCVIYEVNNTFGDRTAYVHSANACPAERPKVRKTMHVSPFMEMNHEYEFAVGEPGETFSLGIMVRREGETWLFAELRARRRELNDKTILATWATHPLVTLKVVVAIHWEAFRLLLKGVAYRSKPHGSIRFNA